MTRYRAIINQTRKYKSQPNNYCLKLQYFKENVNKVTKAAQENHLKWTLPEIQADESIAKLLFHDTGKLLILLKANA